MSSSGTERVLVIIPAWNEEETISSVIREIRSARPSSDVLVVNDGSTDSTVFVAQQAGATVLDLPLNLGVGGAMRAGYKYAEREGYSWAVQVDADGQHDPHEVRHLMDVARATGADVVVGSRFAGKGEYEARGPRRLAMRFLASILSRVARTPLSDVTSGFKLSGRRAIELFSQNYPAEYLGDTVEALVIASRAHLTVREVAVQMRPRAGGVPSHGPWKSTVFLFRAMLALLVALTRPSTNQLEG